MAESDLIQTGIYGLHRLPSALRIAGAADDRPALRQRVDLAFRVDMRTERFAVIEVGAPIPFPIPALVLDICLQLPRLCQATLGKRNVVAATG